MSTNRRPQRPKILPRYQGALPEGLSNPANNRFSLRGDHASERRPVSPFFGACYRPLIKEPAKEATYLKFRSLVYLCLHLTHSLNAKYSPCKSWWRNRDEAAQI